MKLLSRLVVAGLLLAAMSRAGQTQDAAPQAAPEQPAIKLAYKFQPGAVFRYHFATKGTLTLDMSKFAPPGAAGQMPGAMPIDLEIQYDLVQKVKSVADDGSATVSQTVDAGAMNYRVMGMSVAGKLKNGKMTLTMNGQPMAVPNAPGADLPAGQTVETRIAPSGRVLEIKGQLNDVLKRFFAGQNSPQMFGMGEPGQGILVLPEQPVKIGEQWENQSTLQFPVPLPGNQAGATLPKAEFKISYTLRELQEKGTRQIAVIDTKTEVNMPRTEVALPQRGNTPGPGSITVENFTLTVTGTNFFDVTNGALSKGDYAARMALQMQMPAPNTPAAAPPGTMSLDGSYTMAMALRPSPPAKPLAAPGKKKPARRASRGR